MEITSEELLNYMLISFQNIDKELKKAKQDENLINQKQQDLLHYIENESLNAGGYSKVGKLLKSIRRERRIIKNNIEKIEIIQRFATKYNNKMIQGDLMVALKELKELNQRQEKPIYYNRTDILEELRNTNENSNSVAYEE